MARVEVLVVTMHQPKGDYSLLEKMNIQTDAIVCNQCDRNEFEQFEWKGHAIRWMSFAERGVGLNRNNGLMRATADILLFADDDVVYEDGYEAKVLAAYEKHPSAGMIVFNVVSTNLRAPNRITPKDTKLSLFNCLKYGTYRFSVKRETVLKKNVYFSLLYGGGAKYQSGEDSLFILQMIRNGVKTVASATQIGNVSHPESTWFKGYTEAYYVDKGAWLANAFPILKHIFIFYFAYKMRNNTENYGFFDIYRLMKAGFAKFQKQ